MYKVSDYSPNNPNVDWRDKEQVIPIMAFAAGQVMLGKYQGIPELDVMAPAQFLNKIFTVVAMNNTQEDFDAYMNQCAELMLAMAAEAAGVSDSEVMRHILENSGINPDSAMGTMLRDVVPPRFGGTGKNPAGVMGGGIGIGLRKSGLQNNDQFSDSNFAAFMESIGAGQLNPDEFQQSEGSDPNDEQATS